MTTIEDLLPEFLQHLEDERRLQPATVRGYQLDLMQIHEFVKGKPFPDVTLEDLRAFMRHMKSEGNKGGTTRRKLHALSTFYEFEMLNQVVAVNVARQAQRLAPKRRRKVLKKLLTADEWRRFATTPTGKTRDDVAWGLLAWLGMRSAELRGLRVRDIEFENQTLVVSAGKGGNERRLPIPPALLESIEKLMWKKPPHAYLLRGEWGGRWGKDAYYNAFKEHLNRCEIGDHVTPHWLRHTVASALAGEMNVFELREWMGHISTRTTELYVHTSPGALIDAMKKHPLNDDD